MALISSLFGCGKAKPENTAEPVELPPAFTPELPEVPGKLAGITYEYSAGSMVWGSEFDIDLNPEEIVSCAFWEHEGDMSEMTRREHIAVTEEQWADIEKAVMDLWGRWEEIPESVLNQKPDPDMQILDGGGYNRLWLTWETENGKEKISYYYPSDRRMTTLNDLLKELADPKGREIKWYDPPYLQGAYYSDEKTDFSFQCTCWDGEENGYRLIVYFDGFKGDRIDDKIGDDIWKQAKRAFEWLDVSKFEDGSYNEKISLSLYYSDGAQKTIKLDKKTADIIESYLIKISREYLNNK